MSNFYRYDPASTHGKYLQDAIVTNQRADRCLADVMAVMVQMLDGDGSDDAHFATIQARFGFESVAAAHAAFNEISAAYGKTRGDEQVDHVRAARDQLFARLTV